MSSTLSNDDQEFRPDYWADPDYAIPDESDLNPVNKPRRVDNE